MLQAAHAPSTRLSLLLRAVLLAVVLFAPAWLGG
jgi:hypothetical protein